MLYHCRPALVRIPIGRWLRMPAFALLSMALWATASGCCLIDALTPPDPFAKQVALLSPQTVSLHTHIPYRNPVGDDVCGLCCLDMLFAYEKVELPPADIARLREKAGQENGLTVNDLVALLQAAGFKTLRHQGQFEWPAATDAANAQANAAAAQAGLPPAPWFKNINNPLSQIHFGRPVILRLMLKPGVFHFVLLVGYDEPGKSYILLNPGLGPMVVPADNLDRLWLGGERVFVAYKPPDKAAASIAAPTPPEKPAPGAAPVQPPVPTLPK